LTDSASFAGGLGVLSAANIPGDYNGDGKVNGADYVLWRRDPASYGGDPAGYTAWRMNFGDPPGSGSGLAGESVPEPASGGLLLLFAVGGAVIAIRRRRQRSGPDGWPR
jgi:hypothetical protein